MKSKKDKNRILNYLIAIFSVILILLSLVLLINIFGKQVLMELNIVKKDYSYFSTKYPDLKDRDACLKKYSEYVETYPAMISTTGSPCKGTPQ